MRFIPPVDLRRYRCEFDDFYNSRHLVGWIVMRDGHTSNAESSRLYSVAQLKMDIDPAVHLVSGWFRWSG